MWKIAPAKEFLSVRAKWQEVADRASQTVLLDFDFVYSLLQAFGSGNEFLAVYEGRNGPEAATLAYRVKPGVWSTFQPTEACLGIWIQTKDANQQSLAFQLMRQLPGMAFVFGITQQDPKLLRRPGDSAHVRTLDYIRTAWIALSGNFEQYWAARGKNLRTNMKRARADLAKTGIQAKLEVATQPQEVRAAVEEYSRLEASGWKAKTGTAVQIGNAQGKFYSEMLEWACRRGIGRIYRYVLGDSTAAMDLCIDDGDSLIILKTAYDERHARLSPASLMREEQIRRLFDEGRFQRIEFYGPVMEWHTRWTKEERTMYHVNYYRYRFIPWIQGIARRATGKKGAKA